MRLLRTFSARTPAILVAEEKNVDLPPPPPAIQEESHGPDTDHLMQGKRYCPGPDTENSL